MKNPVEKSALALAALKAGQQTLHDLDSIVLNDSMTDVARYVAEQYICRLGSPLVAAYAIDKAVSYGEELVLPKFMRGLFPLTAATIGTALAINYFGNYFNMEQGLGIVETTKQLVYNYQNSLAELAVLDPNAHAGYLTGAALILKSGARLAKNICETIAHYAEKKKAEAKYKQEEEISDIAQQNTEK